MQDRPLLGILLMLGFCILAPLGDSLAKLLGQTLPLIVLLLARFAIQAVVLFPLVFTALQYLPLADAVAIAFVMPFIMLILGHYVLGEEIGLRRILACLVGFIGTLLVIQPAFEAVGWPALLPLVVAVVFSLFMLVTRAMAKDVDPIGLQAVNGLMATGLLLPVMLLFSSSGWEMLNMRAPAGPEIPMLLAIGLIGTAAHLLMTWSLRYAPSATLAPMQYLEIPFATLIGWIIFTDLPNPLASIGIIITIFSGLYIVMRERATSRQAAAPAV